MVNAASAASRVLAIAPRGTPSGAAVRQRIATQLLNAAFGILDWPVAEHNLNVLAVDAMEARVDDICRRLQERVSHLSPYNREALTGCINRLKTKHKPGVNDLGVLEEIREIEYELSALEAQAQILEIAQHLPEDMSLELKKDSHVSLNRLNEGADVELVLLSLFNLYEKARLYGFYTLTINLADRLNSDDLRERAEEELEFYTKDPVGEHENVLWNLKGLVGRALRQLSSEETHLAVAA